jgi:broad specificity phosphatase PhoE
VTADRVVLLRHGRTPENDRGVWQGQLDTELDEVGRDQAAAAAATLAEAVAGHDPVRLVASPLRRAGVTAQYLADAAGLTVTQDARVREVDVGRWQGRTHAEILAEEDGDELAAWLDDQDVRAGGAELRSDLGRRGAEAVREHAVAQDGGILVVVSHGALIRGAVLTLLGLDGGGWRLLAGVGNCHWVELQPGDPHWRLVAYNRAARPGLVPIYPHRVPEAAGNARRAVVAGER